jgi:FAD/FMN-containing dehydrogenase/Fe-S oxidoreductase
MDSDQKRVEDDLRGVIEGDVECGDLYAQMYSTDASIYQLQPLGVVRPRSVEDCAAVVKYARENQLAIHARGAGSGLAGQSLGRGIVLDFSRYMRRTKILQDHSVRVQPGVILASLNRELQQCGRIFGPDPSTRSVTTMGSVIAQNASGSHFLRYGTARNYVQSLQVVTGTGEILELSKHQRSEPGSAGRLAHQMLQIHERYERNFPDPEATPAVGRGGYALQAAVSGSMVDLAKLIPGSEGTLALVTDATLSTEPVPKHRGVVMLFFRRLEQAARGALAALAQGVVACDLMDRRLLEIARETDHRYDQLIPREAEAMILAELQGDGLPELRDRLRALISEICERLELAFAVRSTTEQNERDFYWRLCRRVIPRLYRLKGSSRPLPFVEDMAVPAKHLPEFLVEVQDVLKRHQVTATVFAHAGHGQLHLRPFLDLASSDDQRKIVPLSDDLFSSLQKFDGVICGEHGAGLSRSQLLRRQLGPLWPAMVEIKRVFDPDSILNPGKVVSNRLPRADENLRAVTARIALISGNSENADGATAASVHNTSVHNTSVHNSGANLAAAGAPGSSAHLSPVGEGNADVDAATVVSLPLLQSWEADAGLDRVTRLCNGCGRCRSSTPNERMCPVFRAIPAEEASPRAKANLMRGVLTGDLPPETLHSDGMKQVADLCFHCHQCRLECPASVDIPKLVSEIKGNYVATNGLPLSDLWFCRLDTIVAVAGLMPNVANWLTASPTVRWLLERSIGLSRARKIPPFANRNFMRYATRMRLTRPVRSVDFRSDKQEKVVYFVDQFANWHDPDLGRALVEVLQHNNIDVYVPPKQVPCGMTQIAAGDLKGAARRARQNVRILAEAVRAGYKIVATEPTAVLCLKREYVNLLGTEDAKLVAENAFEACRYLWNRHCQNALALDFKPVPARVAYHQPCHVRAIDEGQPGPDLLRLLPRLNVEEVDQGCTGMAGTWGLQKKNYRNSLRIGWPLLSTLRKSTIRTATTECSACKMQIEHGSGLTTLHPIKLLAYAYGKMPELGAALGSRT